MHRGIHRFTFGPRGATHATNIQLETGHARQTTDTLEAKRQKATGKKVKGKKDLMSITHHSTSLMASSLSQHLTVNKNFNLSG